MDTLIAICDKRLFMDKRSSAIPLLNDSIMKYSFKGKNNSFQKVSKIGKLAGSKLGGWFRNLCSPIKPSIQVWKNAINIQNCVGQTHQNLICQKFHSTVYWRIRLSPNIRQCLFLSYGINLLNTKVINMCMWFNWKPTYVCSLHFLNPSKLFTCKRSSCFNWMEWIQKERLSEWKKTNRNASAKNAGSTAVRIAKSNHATTKSIYK